MSAPTGRTPRQRWGTCCAYDPECDHSFLKHDALTRWMDTPISDEQAFEYERDDAPLSPHFKRVP